MNTVKIIISLVVQKNRKIFQLDVKNALLNGELDVVCMSLLSGYEESEKYCQLKKALYGLKQTLRAWFGRLQSVMKREGYS